MAQLRGGLFIDALLLNFIASIGEEHGHPHPRPLPPLRLIGGTDAIIGDRPLDLEQTAGG